MHLSPCNENILKCISGVEEYLIEMETNQFQNIENCSGHHFWRLSLLMKNQFQKLKTSIHNRDIYWTCCLNWDKSNEKGHFQYISKFAVLPIGNSFKVHLIRNSFKVHLISNSFNCKFQYMGGVRMGSLGSCEPVDFKNLF